MFVVCNCLLLVSLFCFGCALCVCWFGFDSFRLLCLDGWICWLCVAAWISFVLACLICCSLCVDCFVLIWVIGFRCFVFVLGCFVGFYFLLLLVWVWFGCVVVVGCLCGSYCRTCVWLYVGALFAFSSLGVTVLVCCDWFDFGFGFLRLRRVCFLVCGFLGFSFACVLWLF